MIIPAIDLQNGEAVRLYKGDYEQKTVYDKNPVELAVKFEKMGARYLHVVDLDGAKDGSAVNFETIRAIRERIKIPLQVGGGIRTADMVSFYLDEIGINRVILGTIAVREPEFVREMVKKHGAERIVVGVDVKNGKVQTGGWLDDSGVDYLEFIELLKNMGVRFIVATDISRDGTLTSPNWKMYSKISGVNVIVSGGVSCEADIRKALDYHGVIVGKAYYENKVNLAEMLKRKIVPCLDIKNGKVVKGVNFVNLKDIGDPVEIAEFYEKQGADEIVILDITATNENRESIFSLLERITQNLNIPVTFGGGLHTLEDMRKAFAAGVDKISANSAFVNNPKLISEASSEFGKGRIVAAIDAKKVGNKFHVVVKGGKEDTGIELVEWAKKCEELGIGSILLTSMDCDGVQSGYDIYMTKTVVDNVSIPVIASGGCGKVSDIIDVFKQTDCDAALVASLLHFGKATVSEIKSEMERSGIPCGK